MSNDTLVFEMAFEADASVARGCCGRDHDLGPCPYKNEEAA